MHGETRSKNAWLSPKTKAPLPRTSLEGRVQGCKQHRLTERLEETIHRATLQCKRTNGFVPAGGNEDNGNITPALRQFLLQFKARHARHGHVENQALGDADAIGQKEGLCRG